MDKRIWAVGGGKGGTGKSFIAASLGLHLASLERNVLLIDVDLGAPNLHTLLGIRNGHPDLGDFLTNQVSTLEEAGIETPFRGLRIVRGAENVLFIANLNHYKKLRLLRQIRQAKAQETVLDLGTGSSYNSLDFFLSASPGIVVATPEPTSIENSYLFLKSCIMRVLKIYMDHYRIPDLHQKMLQQIEKNSQSLYGFFKSLVETDKTYGTILYRAMRNFRPCLIMNKTRSEKDEQLGRFVADVARKYLLIDLRYLGGIPYDDKVDLSLRDLRPFLIAHRDTPAAQALRRIAEDMIYAVEFTHRTPADLRPADT
jgi:flagellar biosynthesis protein FlhG